MELNKIPILWDQKCVNLPRGTSWIVIDYKQCFSLRINDFILKYFIVSIMKRKYDLYWDLTKNIRCIQNIIRPRENRFSSGIWKTINLLLPRNILLLKHTKTYFSTSTLLIPLNKFSLLWRTILCGITNGFLMVFSAEDVTRGNGLSSYISPIKRLMIQYNLMTVMLPDTSKAQNDITL